MNVLIVQPIINLLLLFYQWLGHQTILAVVVVTLIFRLALTPLTLNQRLSHRKSTRKRREFQSNMMELREKYKDDPAKLAGEQIKLYQDININPASGCLMTLIQLPIMIGVYRAIIHVLAATPLQLLALPSQIYPWIPNLSTLIPLNSRFLWLDLALPDPYLILPILVFAASWFRQKVSLSFPNNAQQKWSKYINIAIPLLITFLSASYASGLAIYLLISSFIGILEHALIIRPYVARLQDQKDSKPEGAEHQPTTRAVTGKHNLDTVSNS